MTFRSLIPYLLGGIAALVIAGTYITFMLPASRGLDRKVDEVEQLLPEIEARQDQLIGRLYEQTVDEARIRAELTLNEIEAELRRQRVRLRRWFPRLEVTGSGAPHRDSFRDAYAYNQDELVREISRIVREETKKDVIQVPLYQPPFYRKSGRLPADAEEMAQAQLAFNLERLFLTQAAMQGALPFAATEIRHDWSRAGRDRNFLETAVVLKLEVFSHRIPRLLRGLLTPSAEDIIVRVDSISIAPRSLPARLGDAEDLPIEATIRLVVLEHDSNDPDRPGSNQ